VISFTARLQMMRSWLCESKTRSRTTSHRGGSHRRHSVAHVSRLVPSVPSVRSRVPGSCASSQGTTGRMFRPFPTRNCGRAHTHGRAEGLLLHRRRLRQVHRAGCCWTPCPSVLLADGASAFGACLQKIPFRNTSTSLARSTDGLRTPARSSCKGDALLLAMMSSDGVLADRSIRLRPCLSLMRAHRLKAHPLSDEPLVLSSNLEHLTPQRSAVSNSNRSERAR